MVGLVENDTVDLQNPMSQVHKSNPLCEQTEATGRTNTSVWLVTGAADFDLSDERKQALVGQGIKGAEIFCQWFETEHKKPVNCLPL